MTEHNFLYLNAIKKQPVERTPIWIMRQAGRYLPEYRTLRDKHHFLEMCKTPELAAEVTLQPIRCFAFDAAILFSDILVVPEAMGQKLEFDEGHGPKLSPPIRQEKGILNLRLDELETSLDYVAQAIQLINGELAGKTPLIGFSGSPFTLATYMIEGKPGKNFKHIKTMLYAQPQLLERLLDLLTEAVSRYLILQVEAGVHALQIFDTWGGILPVHLYHAFSARFMEKIVRSLKPFDVPVTLFSKGGIELLKQLGGSEPAMLGVDWMTDLAEARKLFGDRFALQGNLDPTTLYGCRGIISREVSRILDVFGADSGHVFNLGHGILPDIPVDNVQFLVDEVHAQSVKLRA